jgi:hypothetical protein
MWRESLAKQGTMMEGLARLREQVKGKEGMVQEKMVRLESGLGECEYKVNSLVK